MASASYQERFCNRLQRLLQEADQNQAWLVEQTGLSSSVLSRLVRGDRLPTFEHLAAIAPVLGSSVDLLVAGTDAEARIAEASQFVPRAHYEAVHRQLIEDEWRKNELESQLRQTRAELEHEKAQRLDTQKELTDQLGQAHLKLERSDHDLDEARQQLRRYQEALHQAACDVAVLKGKLQEVQAAVKDGTNASRLAAALAGVAAVGAVTAAAYLARTKSAATSETPPTPSAPSGRPHTKQTK